MVGDGRSEYFLNVNEIPVWQTPFKLDQSKLWKPISLTRESPKALVFACDPLSTQGRCYHNETALDVANLFLCSFDDNN